MHVIVIGEVTSALVILSVCAFGRVFDCVDKLFVERVCFFLMFNSNCVFECDACV